MQWCFFNEDSVTDLFKVCSMIALFTGVQNGSFMFSSSACLCLIDGVLLNRTYPHFLKWLIGHTGDDGSEAEGVIKDYFGRQVWEGGAASVEW